MFSEIQLDESQAYTTQTAPQIAKTYTNNHRKLVFTLFDIHITI